MENGNTLIQINDVTTAELTKELSVPTGAKSVSLQSVVNSITGTSIQSTIEESLDGTNWHSVAGADAGAQSGATSALARSSGTAGLGKLRLKIAKTAITVLDVDVSILVHYGD